jgi:uncharacterized protein YlxP (DUF503 family)
MVVGLLTAELRIPEANSLKDKRQVLKSLLARLRSSFNISVTEVDNHDIWRTATIAIVLVATDGRYANEVLDKVIDHVQSDPRLDLGHYEIEMM